VAQRRADESGYHLGNLHGRIGRYESAILDRNRSPPEHPVHASAAIKRYVCNNRTGKLPMRKLQVLIAAAACNAGTP